jgi:hypothetical protein
MPTADELRRLADWYREFAKCAGEPWIWEARLRTAKELEAEATQIENEPVSKRRETAAVRQTHSGSVRQIADD